MHSTNSAFAAQREKRTPEAAGIGPALIGGWVGGTVLATLALFCGLGWLAAIAGYSIGGALLVFAFAVLPPLHHIRARLRLGGGASRCVPLVRPTADDLMDVEGKDRLGDRLAPAGVAAVRPS